MADRRFPGDERRPVLRPDADASRPTRDVTATSRPERAAGARDRAQQSPAKFASAADGWDAYNAWLDRVRQPAAPTSRQAVIAKALYSVSSYKNWADKARDAFDAPLPVASKAK